MGRNNLSKKRNWKKPTTKSLKTNKHRKSQPPVKTKPVLKICVICKKRRVKHHHVKCDICWNEENAQKKHRLNNAI